MTCGYHQRLLSWTRRFFPVVAVRRCHTPGPGPALAGFCIAWLVGCLGGCQPIDDYPGYEGPRLAEPVVPRPMVERDLQAIVNAGTIRMITRYNGSSYFIHRGGGAGFDFELLRLFAAEHGLTLEVVIPEPSEDLVSLLNSGRGDVICAGLTQSPLLDQYASATRPVSFVQKVLVLPPGDQRPATLASLAGLTITLPLHDTFRIDLLQLRKQDNLGFILQTAHPLVEQEELIAMVTRGEIQATVADDIVVNAARAYLPDVHTGVTLGERIPVVWLARSNCPDLRTALNAFIKEHFWVMPSGAERRSQTYGIIYDRYFRNELTIRSLQVRADRPDKSGRISRYDAMIRNQAESYGLDWRLVSALVYQESRFDPQAVSSAGAVGLMQVLPTFAADQADSLFDPGANVRAGLHLLKGTYDGFAYLDSLDRVRFTLAVYHAGYGHVTDARRIAMDLGRDPDAWSDALDEALPRLMERSWYGESRHGFYRGAETVRYVEEIMNRFAMYARLVPRFGPLAPLSDVPDDDTAAAAQPSGE